jgi:protein-S-isoprenylcysteine O-methyltransferase Ste14
MNRTHPTHPALPELGRRGGGWVAVQIALLAAILLSAFAGAGWPSSAAPAAYAVGGVAIACGAALLLSGGIRLGSARALTPFPAPRRGAELRTDGAYRLVRHPMYGGGILVGAGWSILFATVPGAVLTAVLAVFADLKSRREELWLDERFPGYGEYRARTPRRLIPFVR